MADDVKVTVRLNGPYRIEGPFTMVDQDGGQFSLPEGQFVTLCRCGWSDNKPYCDGSHRHNEPSFDAPTTAS